MKPQKLLSTVTVLAFAAALLTALLATSGPSLAFQSNLPTLTYTPTPLAATPTDTPLPTPTDTPVPPTNTPVPPTNTPVPPTSTPTPIPPPPTLGSFSIIPLEGVAQINDEIVFTVVFTDPGLSINPGFATFFWGDGDTSTCPPDNGACLIDPGVGSVDDVTSSPTFTVGEVEGRHAYSEPGVYTVQLALRDEFGQIATSTYEYVVVYDPTAGFVTGGGWIDSPLGAYVPDPTLAGKATFGFVSKYKRGAQIPSGNTEFQFKAGDLNFSSDSYDWLVIAGHKAMYKGTGTINGGGNYGFQLSAIDAALTPSTDVDLFRIKIWDKDNGDALIYDNQLGDADDADPATPIGGGSIVIHSGQNNRNNMR